MTLVAAWLRRNSTLRELVIASDSRISGGESWDACPKIVPLPRPATVIAMSGNATGAYSFLLQAINTCNLLDGHVAGRTDIGYLANKLRDVYADSRTHVKDLPSRAAAPDVLTMNVVLLGWSWRNLKFEGYSYRYTSEGRLVMTQLGQLDEETSYPAYLFGDASSVAWRKLKELVRTRGLPVPMRGHADAASVARNSFFDWEPLEVLLDVIGDSSVRTVGGVPQVMKIYQYGASEGFVWRARDGVDHFGGRPILPSERFDRRIIEIGDGGVRILYSDHAMTETRDQQE